MDIFVSFIDNGSFCDDLNYIVRIWRLLYATESPQRAGPCLFLLIILLKPSIKFYFIIYNNNIICRCCLSKWIVIRDHKITHLYQWQWPPPTSPGPSTRSPMPPTGTPRTSSAACASWPTPLSSPLASCRATRRRRRPGLYPAATRHCSPKWPFRPFNRRVNAKQWYTVSV